MNRAPNNIPVPGCWCFDCELARSNGPLVKSEVPAESKGSGTREATLREINEAVAPQGQAYCCPDCDSWASLGCNAAFHAWQTKHGVPTLKQRPSCVSTQAIVRDDASSEGDLGDKARAQGEVRARGAWDAALREIRERLKTQDNRITQNPMFCVQIKRRDVGYDSQYSDRRCWHDSANEQTVYDDDPNFKEPDGLQWDVFGYVDRWETVMVAFTEVGCEQYLHLNGHNDRAKAHNGEVRIYVASFNRCPEMIAIREALMSDKTPSQFRNTLESDSASTLTKEPTPWIATATKPPTKEDGNRGKVLAKGGAEFESVMWEAVVEYPWAWPYWMKIPELPNK